MIEIAGFEVIFASFKINHIKTVYFSYWNVIDLIFTLLRLSPDIGPHSSQKLQVNVHKSMLETYVSLADLKIEKLKKTCRTNLFYPNPLASHAPKPPGYSPGNF